MPSFSARARLPLAALVAIGPLLVPLHTPTAQAAAGELTVTARSDTAAGIGAAVEVRVQGETVGYFRVDRTSWTNYRVDLPSTLSGGETVEVRFTNDTSSPSDRNLYVRSVTSGGTELAATDSGVVYDRGDSWAEASDNRDTISGQEAMYWNGALRFTWPGGSGGQERPTTTTQQTDDAGSPLWSAGLSSFQAIQPGGAVQGVDYGVNGDGTLWFDSHRQLTLANNSPRSQGISPYLIERGGEYWTALSFRVDGNTWMSQDSWIGIHTSAFGPPWHGPSPLGLAVVRDAQGPLLQLSGDRRVLGERARIRFGGWVNYAVHYKAAPASEGGFAQVWVNTGSGWTKVLDKSMDVVKPGNNDSGPNYVAMGVYGDRSHRADFARLQVGRTLGSVNRSGAYWTPLSV